MKQYVDGVLYMDQHTWDRTDADYKGTWQNGQRSALMLDPDTGATVSAPVVICDDLRGYTLRMEVQERDDAYSHVINQHGISTVRQAQRAALAIREGSEAQDARVLEADLFDRFGQHIARITPGGAALEPWTGRMVLIAPPADPVPA